jgi:hypothetical protein
MDWIRIKKCNVAKITSYGNGGGTKSNIVHNTGNSEENKQFGTMYLLEDSSYT